MASSGASGRRITPETILETILPWSFGTLTPVLMTEKTTTTAEDKFLEHHKGIMIHLDEITAEQFEIIEFVDAIDAEDEIELIGVFRTYNDLAKSAPESHSGTEQLAHHPYPAEHIELLFDATTPEATDEDLILRSIFAPAYLPQVFRLIKQVVVSRSPTPRLIDTSDLKLQPTPAVQDFRDDISQMLDFDPLPVNDVESQDTDSKVYVPMHTGRSLMRPPPPCSDPVVDMYSFNTQGTFTTSEERVEGKLKAVTADDLTGKTPCAWEVEYERVLRHITGYAFLPGLKHFTNIEVRSAFTTYDDDMQALNQATEMFMDDHHDGECNCLDDSSGKIGRAVLPGENFLLSQNDEGLGLSTECPTAQSILDLIDELVGADAFVEIDTTEENIFDMIDRYVDADMLIGADTADDYPDPPKTPRLGAVCDADIQRVATSSPLDQLQDHQEGGVEEGTPHLGAFFDADLPNMVTYIALAELLKPLNNFSHPCHVYTNTDDHVSDMSDNEGDGFSMTQSSELTYFDADTQKFCAYTAFNQLLDVGDNEMLPRIHRDYDDDYDVHSDADVLEIFEHDPSRNVASSLLRVTNETTLDIFDINIVRSPLGAMPQPALTWSDMVQPATLHSGKSKRGRPRLTVMTQLEPIPEEGSETFLSSPSSADSLDFEYHRDYVKPLSSRRINFLEEEDEEDGVLESVHSAHYSNIPDTVQTSPFSVVVEGIDDLFSGDIWHAVPILTLNPPSSPPPAAALSSTDSFPDPGLFKALEIEIRGLLKVMFECVNDDRLDELPVLSKDLHWALNTIAQDFPIMSLSERLGAALEVIVERTAASGTT